MSCSHRYKVEARPWGGLHLRHYPGYPPLLWDKKLGMMLFSADILHLIYINLFKQHVEPMIFVFLLERPRGTRALSIIPSYPILSYPILPAAVSEDARAPVESFFHSFSIPIKLAKAGSMVDVSQSLTGRDCRVLCEKASEILPAVLDWAHAPQEAVEEAAKQAAQAARGVANAPLPAAAHENVFTMRRPAGADDADADEEEEDDDDDADRPLTPEELQARKLLYAGYLDDFLKVVRAVRPFTEDTPEYRMERATELFNAGVRAEIVLRLRRDFEWLPDRDVAEISKPTSPAHRIQGGQQPRRAALRIRLSSTPCAHTCCHAPDGAGWRPQSPLVRAV